MAERRPTARPTKDATITVRLPRDLLAELDALAAQEERALADVVRRVLRRGLDAGGRRPAPGKTRTRR